MRVVTMTSDFCAPAAFSLSFDLISDQKMRLPLYAFVPGNTHTHRERAIAGQAINYLDAPRAAADVQVG